MRQILKPARLAFLIFYLLLSTQLAFAAQPAAATEPQVRAVLFYSPSCGHCQLVLTEALPPLETQYGQQLLILKVDVTQPAGAQLYTAAHTQAGIKPRGVPVLFVGETVLLGSVDIPGQFPELIETSLKAGGVDWPTIPGLADYLAANPPEDSASSPPDSPTVGATAVGQASAPTQILPTAAVPVESAATTSSLPWIQRFQRDPLGNSLAVLMLVVLLASLLWVGYAFLKPLAGATGRWPVWAVPVLALLGIGVAGYLTYIETTGRMAICGPVGDCNSVQQSPYARLLGIIPVGVLGLAGYLAILAAWVLQARGPASWKSAASVALWGFALFGVIFSLYLTFLEPFVIGATCMWCLTSALLITLILWASSSPAIQVWET